MQGNWNAPVILEVYGIGRYRTIMSTEEAITCLLDEWLFDEGEALERAFAVCLVAREGEASHETARLAFIQAAQEAAIYIVPESLADLHEGFTLPKEDLPARWRRKPTANN
jgi:hypothetical protein